MSDTRSKESKRGRKKVSSLSKGYLNDLKLWAGNEYTGADNYLMQQAVRDGNIITANGTAALEFAKEVLSALNAATEEKIMGWYSFHKLGYYEASMPEM